MFNKIASVLYLSVIASCAQAQSQDSFTFVRILHSQPNYINVAVNVPQTQCYNVNVPVYSQRNSGAGNVFTGMVLGGVAGNVIGGNDKSTAIGAIIGGVIAAEPRSHVSGYVTQQQCETVYLQKVEQRVDGYLVTYTHKNQNGTVYSPFYFQPGSLVSVQELTTGKKSF